MNADRRAGQDILDELAAGLVGIERSPMFGSSGVRRNGQLLAFVGGSGELILRVPQERAEAFRAAGRAGDVRMGRGTAREWISIPLPDGDGPGEWAELLDVAYAHAG